MRFLDNYHWSYGCWTNIRYLECWLCVKYLDTVQHSLWHGCIFKSSKCRFLDFERDNLVLRGKVSIYYNERTFCSNIWHTYFEMIFLGYGNLNEKTNPWIKSRYSWRTSTHIWKNVCCAKIKFQCDAIVFIWAEIDWAYAYITGPWEKTWDILPIRGSPHHAIKGRPCSSDETRNAVKDQ